jgi:hypothetical protein
MFITYVNYVLSSSDLDITRPSLSSLPRAQATMRNPRFSGRIA